MRSHLGNVKQWNYIENITYRDFRKHGFTVQQARSATKNKMALFKKYSKKHYEK